MTGPVLIIEDNVDIAEILRYALEKENYETRFKQNEWLQSTEVSAIELTI